MTPCERAKRAKAATDWRDCACGYCTFYVDGECRRVPPFQIPACARYPSMGPEFRACAMFERPRPARRIDVMDTDD